MNEINIPEQHNVSIEQLKEDGKNPNHMTAEKLRSLMDVISKYGFLVPIITNKDYLIADGAHRVKAAKALGMKEVPVIALDVQEVDRRMLRQIMNKLKGSHDKDLDFEEYQYIYEQDAYEEFRSFLPDVKEYEDLLEKQSKKRDPNDFDATKAAKERKYQVKVGDVYQLGNHRLMCGDSTKEEHVKTLVGKDHVKATFTDPPYGVSYTGLNNPNGREWEMIKNDDLRGDALYDFLKDAFTAAKKVSQENAALYSCYATTNHIQFEKALIEAGWIVKQVLVWDKGHILGRSDYHWCHEPILYCRTKEQNTDWYGDRTQKTILNRPKRETEADLAKMKKEDLVRMLMSIREASDVVHIQKDSAQSYVHPTQKPIELPKRIIRNSTKIGDVVLDLFGGSGSTLIACEVSSRKARVMEFDPKFCSAIIQRWEELTGEKHVKIEEGE